MSKIGKSSGLGDVKPVTTTTAFGRLTRASSNAAKLATGKSVVSIEVNMESSYEMNAPPPPPAAAAAKKKRLALGNISNADGIQQSGQQTNPTAPVTKDAKKYRFGGSNIANIASVMPGFGHKKSDNVPLPKKTSIKSSSKENLNQGLVPSKKTTVIKKSLTTTETTLSKSSVSKSENDIKKQVDSLSLAVEVSSSSSSMSLTTTTVSSMPSVPSTISFDQNVVERGPRRPDQITGWEDIDVGDTGDEFTCSEYIRDIFNYYRNRENMFTVKDYLSSPVTNINRAMRFLLVDWMVEVQQQLEFNHEVLYLSVKLLDLYLSRQLVDKEKLQLLAAASMFLACKFEERMPPVIEDFILVSDSAYGRRDIIKMEMEIFKTVAFDLGVPLSYTFLRRYSKCIRADMKFLTLARYILELSLQDYTFAPERDSLKACAALYLAMKMAVAYETQSSRVSNNPVSSPPMLYVSTANLTSTEWNPTLIHYTNAFVKDFVHLIQPMNSLVKNAPNSKYKTIYRKYSHPVFFEVAKVPALNDFQVELILNSNEMVH